MGKNIVFLSLQVTLIHYLHEFILYKGRVMALKLKQVFSFVMLSLLQSHLLRYGELFLFYSFVSSRGIKIQHLPESFLVQCSISLSVICPKQLPKLKAIYSAVRSSTLNLFFQCFSCLNVYNVEIYSSVVSVYLAYSWLLVT